MSRAERWVIRLWWLITALAAVAMLMPVLLLLLVLGIVTIPLAALGWLAPTIWIYLTPAILLYAVLRDRISRRGIPLILLVIFAAALPLGAGYGFVALVNQRIEARAAELISLDRGLPPTLPPVGTAAHVVRKSAAWAEDDRKCGDFCQRLLFTGLAQRVIVGPAEAIDAKADARLTLHELAPLSAGCDNSLLAAVAADEKDVPGSGAKPYLWEKLGDFHAQGRCFRSRPVRSAEADIWFVETYPDWTRFENPPTYDLRLVPVDLLGRHEVFRRRGQGRVRVLRRSVVKLQRLASPLMISVWNDFETGSPGHWSYRPERLLGEPRLDRGVWMTNDLRVPGLEPEAVTIRHRKRPISFD